MASSQEQIELRLVPVQQILDLRHAVLRPGRPRATAAFAGDDEPATRHFGVFERELLLACASCVQRPWEHQPAWQLRGMATLPQRRGQGIGSFLLRGLEAHLAREPGPRLLWCNARVQASNFYLRHGWRIASEQFVIPDVGSHYRMWKMIDGGGGSPSTHAQRS